MSHFGDFMDGVPVKISEKYKRPPKFELPYSVIECPQRAQHVVDNAEYSTTFEKNVLAKVKELRSAKETKKNERKHRLQLLQEAKQKKLDEIAAAEAEEKLKQLSVSEVSYPSTDEISALSPDEKTDKNCDTTPTQDNSPEAVEAATTTDISYPSCSNSEPPNILQPTLVAANYNLNSLLDDPDPLQELKMNTKITKMPQYSNVETLTYKDFENDTSSPFDNVELKTINDMELLAQVLQSQRESATSCIPQQSYTEPMYTMPNCASQMNAESIYIPPTYIEQPIQAPSAIYSPQHYPISNGYYVPTENVCDNPPIQMDNMNMYMTNYPYYVPATYNLDPNYYQNQISNVDLNQPQNGYIPEPYYYHYPNISMQYPAPNQNPTQPQPVETLPSTAASQHTIKSRSRSVPDIVRELNEELALAKQKSTERSYNASPAPKVVPQPSSSNNKTDHKRSKRKSESLPNPFDKLSPKLQDMCKKIHSMGFPLDRVARVCTLVGDNDKKIIEGLLILGELMDLGFSEGRVSAALAKHEFNRDKALDELVS
ncbi:hypothetical protein NE865_04034 [Phthorimaea operculella]|nr:hypothetical protein NE865_04034 [Phthorimaea operculella]